MVLTRAFILLLAVNIAPIVWAPTAIASAANGVPDNEPLKPKLLGKVSGCSGTSAVFTRDGQRILTAGDEAARLWDAATLRPVTDPLVHGQPIVRALLSPDAKLVATVGGTEVRIWDAVTGKPVTRLAHDHPVQAAAFSPDARRLVTAGSDAHVWDLDTWRVQRVLEHKTEVGFVAYSPGGDKILTLSRAVPQGAAFVWDTATGKKLSGPLAEAWYDSRNSRNLS